MSTNAKHSFEFFRAGGLDQTAIRSGADLASLHELPQELWVALCIPTRGIEFDTKTLDLLDTDKDGRIRAPELLHAVRWTLDRVKKSDDLLAGSAAVPIEAFNESSPAGAALQAGAKRILANLGKADAKSITLDDTADTNRIFAATKFNGDGVIPASSAEDAAASKVIEEIMATVGSTPDRSGQPGIDAARLEAFFQQAQSLCDWAGAGTKDAAVQPLAAGTGPALAALAAVRAKVNDYFARCRVAEFDSRATAALNRAEGDFAQFAPKDLTLSSEDIARLPLARVQPGKPLPLTGEVNPAWAGAIAALKSQAVAPALGATIESLTEAQWAALQAKLAAFEAWQGAKPATPVEKLGVDRLRAILATDAKAKIGALIAKDAALEAENAQIKEVDQFIHFYRDLVKLIRNYVNFRDFYDPKAIAVFQTGRLYMDARVCDLCFHVDDAGKHSTLAGASKIYLAYCEASRPGQPKRTICAAFTAGFAETLWVGRNGLFYDRQGNDWDATIVKVVESTISLKEAFWMPWKKMAAMVAEQIKKVMAAKEAAALSAAAKGVEEAGKTVEAGKPAVPPLPKLDGAAIASSVAAIGIAVGLLGAAAGQMMNLLPSLKLWQILAGVAGVILAVSGPSVVLAYFRLRARDLAPILNACGWAVNRRIRMTLSLGRKLTREAVLPEGARRNLADPYEDDNSTRNLIIGLLVVLAILYGAWKFELLDRWLPTSMKANRTPATVVIPAAVVAPAAQP